MTSMVSIGERAPGARGQDPHGLRRLRAFAYLVAVAAAPIPVAGQDRPLAADLAEVYRVGGLNAPQWAFFEGREPTGFDAAGNLYVLDTHASQVVVIDPRGELVRTVGREGEGPGEFDGAGRLFVWPDGRFVVVDIGQGAYQVFGPNGELERYVRMGGGTGRLAFFGGMRLELRADPAGGALIAQGMPLIMEEMSGVIEALAEMTGETVEMPEHAVDESGLERLDLTGEVVSATPILRAWKAPREEVPGITSIEELRDPSKLMGVTNRIRYFEPQLRWDVLPDGTIAYADSTAYAVKLAGPGGRVIDVLRRPFAPATVTDRLRREVIDRELRRHDEDEREEPPEVAGAPEMLTGYLEDMAKARSGSANSTPKSRSSVLCGPPGTGRYGFSGAATVRGTTPAPSTSSARTGSTWEPSPREIRECRPPSVRTVWSCTGNSTNWTCRPSW